MKVESHWEVPPIDTGDTLHCESSATPQGISDLHGDRAEKIKEDVSPPRFLHGARKVACPLRLDFVAVRSAGKPAPKQMFRWQSRQPEGLSQAVTSTLDALFPSQASHQSLKENKI